LYTSLFIEPPELSILEDWGMDGYQQKLPGPISTRFFCHCQEAAGCRLTKLPTLASGLRQLDCGRGPDGSGQSWVTDEQHYTAAIQGEQGVRIDASSAYIYPLLLSGACPIFSVIEGANVTIILIGETIKTAIGVTYVASDDTGVTVTASKEVILPASPFYHSPNLLQLSGVGLTDILTAECIDVVVDLPVGQDALSRSISSVIGGYFSLLELANYSTLRKLWISGKLAWAVSWVWMSFPWVDQW
jgi:choline dehydrogenase-like flavoprotein